VSDNRDAFLDTLAACEGTDTDDGYRALFGYSPRLNPGRVFASFDNHPNIRFPFTQKDGRINYTTAAGRYQENFPTFARLAHKLGTVGFTPAVQDQHALELIAEQGALDDVDAGRFQEALDKCAPIWASLPASKYSQPTRSYAFALAAYTTAGGGVA
jgi:muramidase (phage lysozyme)